MYALGGRSVHDAHDFLGIIFMAVGKVYDFMVVGNVYDFMVVGNMYEFIAVGTVYEFFFFFNGGWQRV